MKLSSPWRNNVGNICVTIWHPNYLGIFIGIGAFFFLALGVLTLNLIFWEDKYLSILLLLILLLILPCFLLYYHSIQRQEKVSILRAFKGELDAHIAEFLRECNQDTFEVKRKVYMPRSSSRKDRYILILLSSGIILEFTCVGYFDESREYLELLPHWCISADAERKEYMRPWFFERIIKGSGLRKKEKLAILIAISFVVASLVPAIFLYLVSTKKYWIIAIAFCYTKICLYAQVFHEKKLTRFADILTLLPFLILRISLPGFVILCSYFFILVFNIGVFGAFFYFLYSWGVVKGDTSIFLTILFSSILPITSRRITRLILRFNPVSDGQGDHKYQYFMKSLALYVTTPKAFNCVVSVLYLVFLAISSVLQFEGDRYIFSKSIDGIVLQAFLVYIAYYTLITRDSKDSEISSNELDQIIQGLFMRDYEEIGNTGSSCSVSLKERKKKRLRKRIWNFL